MKSSRIFLVCAATFGLVVAAVSQAAAAADRTRLQIHQTVDARFPSGLLLVPITSGEAWVMISVDANGQLLDALPTRYTHEAFATEVLRVLRAWRYEPARLDGKPIAVRVELQFSFQASGAIVSMDAATAVRSMLAFAESPTYVRRLCPPEELDQRPVPVRQVAPHYPGNAAASGADQETAVLDFIIDEQGKPRMPVLVNSPGAEFANQAAAALQQWEFSPPTRRGRPVAVRVQQAFIFPARS